MTSSYRSGKVWHLTLLIVSCITVGLGLLIGKNIYADFPTLYFDGFSINLMPRAFPITFSAWDNSHVWWIIIEWTEALPQWQMQQIYFPWNDTTIRCGRKVKWYYFNSARWLRLWPLDNNSLATLKRNDDLYDNLKIINDGWWLYTSCIGHPQDVVGYIKYTEAWEDQWALFFWVSTNSSANTATYSYAASGFILKDGKYPQGEFYDSIVGIGEVYSLIDQVNKGIANTARNITVQWRLGISSVVDSLERNTIKTNIGKKSLIYSTDEVTSSKIINLALKNATIACRGGNTFDNLSEASDSSSKVVCIDTDGTEDINIDSSMADRLVNKDVVIKNSNVIIDKSVYTNEKSLSLFIDKWNLIIDTESISSSDLKNFDNNGYRSSNTTTVTQWILLQGNYIINGLIYGKNSDSDDKTIPVKTFIHGKFASLNLPTTSYLQREKQVANVLETNEYKDRISLANVFRWRCDPMTWKGVFNPNFTTTASVIQCNQANDNHRDSSLIVIEKNYPSTLLLNK